MLFTLAFASAPDLKSLTLPLIITRRTVLQKVRRPPFNGVRQVVNTGFQVLFHSPPGVLFTFPSQYYALSVTEEYLALRSGLRSFRQGFSCLVLLWILLCELEFRLRGFHPLWLAFPKQFFYPHSITSTVRTPKCSHLGLGSFAFARRYLRNRCFFLFLWLLRCFSSPGSLLIPYFIQVWVVEVFSTRFPHSDISGSLLICSSPKLFAAYHVFRRLLVPRHPPCALIA